MDPINNILSAPIPVSLPRPAVSSAPAIPQPQTDDTIPVAKVSQSAPSIPAARAQAAVRTEVQIANLYVLGTQVPVTFADATGQQITRYRDLESGKITYFPTVPQYVKPQSGGSGLSIEA